MRLLWDASSEKGEEFFFVFELLAEEHDDE
jgi:hypothetical protein